MKSDKTSVFVSKASGQEEHMDQPKTQAPKKAASRDRGKAARKARKQNRRKK